MVEIEKKEKKLDLLKLKISDNLANIFLKAAVVGKGTQSESVIQAEDLLYTISTESSSVKTALSILTGKIYPDFVNTLHEFSVEAKKEKDFGSINVLGKELFLMSPLFFINT